MMKHPAVSKWKTNLCFTPFLKTELGPQQGWTWNRNVSSDTTVNDYRWVTAGALSSRQSRDIGIIFLTVCCRFSFCCLRSSNCFISRVSRLSESGGKKKRKDWTIVWHRENQGERRPKLSVSLHSFINSFSLLLPLPGVVLHLCLRLRRTHLSDHLPAVRPSARPLSPWCRWARKRPALQLSPSACSLISHSQRSHVCCCNKWIKYLLSQKKWCVKTGWSLWPIKSKNIAPLKFCSSLSHIFLKFPRKELICILEFIGRLLERTV